MSVSYNDTRSQTDTVFLKDIGSLVPHPTTGDLIVAKNEKALKLALKTLLQLRPGEIVGNPTAGTSLSSKLFDNITTINANQIKTTIETSIEDEMSNYVEIVKIQVTPDEMNNAYRIFIVVRWKTAPSEIIQFTDILQLV